MENLNQMSNRYKLPDNKKANTRCANLFVPIESVLQAEISDKQILTLLIQQYQSFIKTLSIAARYAVEYVRFDYACLSLKYIYSYYHTRDEHCPVINLRALLARLESFSNH